MMKQIAQHRTHQVLDARSPESFLGKRRSTDMKQLPSHIPGSTNVYYAALRNNTDHTLFSDHDLKSLLKQASVNLELPIVTTCGSGVSAALLALSLYQIGIVDTPLYDGSCAEWSRQ